MEQKMIRLLTTKIGFTILAILISLILFFWQSNRLLIERNKALIQNTKEQTQTISTQKRVLAVVKNTKPNSLAGNIKRMQDGQL